ncbi:MAG: GAF domain-containing protein [Phototrophicaceae bacterium]
MTNQNRIIQIFTRFIAMSMVLIAIISVPQLVSNSVFSIDIVSITVSLTLLYALIVHLNIHSPALAWTGFARFPLFIAWSLFGLSTTIWIALIGISITAIWQRYNNPKNDPDRANNEETKQQQAMLLSIFANNSASLLGLHFIYRILGGLQPVITEADVYSAIDILIISLIATTIISLSLQFILERIQVDKMLRRFYDYLLPELLILLTSILLPSLYLQMGLSIFLITLVVITFLIYRRSYLSTLMINLEARIQEMTALSTLSTTMATHLSLAGTIDSIYKELSKLLDATTFYIALYNEDHDKFDYRLLVINEAKIKRDKEVHDRGLIEYIIRVKQPIRHTRDDIRLLFKNLYDSSDLADKQYMLAPLMVSTKVIGVIGVSHANKDDAFSEHDFALFQTISSQASLAIRNAILYDRTVRLADNLSIINQSLQDVMFNLDRQDALKVSCQIAANVTLTPKAAIFMLDDNQDGQMTCVESVGFEGIEFIKKQVYDPTLFDDGIYVINDIGQHLDDDDLIAHATAGQFKACVQIPLRSGNTVIGTLNVYHDMPYFYETPELNLLIMLTNQITAALDNTDLLQALELYAAEQAQLVYLSRISGNTLELEPIIEGISQTLAPMINVARVAIGITTADKNSIRLETYETSFGLTSIELSGDTIPEIAAILAPNASSTVRFFYADDDKISVGLDQYMKAHGDKTLGLIPMRIDNLTIGVIVLGDVIERHFSENELRLLEMASYQITVQIHNARVHTQTEEQLANRLEQLELIEDISQQISEALELDIIIQNVLEAALQSTQADFASISMMDPKDDSTFDIMWREVVDNELIPNRVILRVTDGVIGHVRTTGEMIIVPDNNQFEAYIPPIDHDKKFNSSLALPMRTGNSVIGVLNLESIHYNFFTGEQASFLKSLAGHAAISIDNANLLVEREQQINTLTLLRELSLDALSIINSDDIYNAVLRTALILLNGDVTALYTYDPINQQIKHLTSLQSDKGQIFKADFQIPMKILQETLTNGRLKFVDDVATSAAFNTDEHFSEISYQSLIIMPVARRQQIYELLCIGFTEKREFTHDDLNIVDLLAVQVAGHLENAALNETITTSNDRMRAILDSTRDGIILLDNAERIQDANMAASTLTRIDLDAYLFKPLADVINQIDSDESAKIWQDISEKYHRNPDAIHNEEFTFTYEDDVVYVKILVISVVDEARDIVGRLLILRDITEEKNLQQFQVMMQSMVLHDLRGPLTSIVTSMYVAENILELYDGQDFETLKSSLNKTFNVSLVSAEDMLRQVDTLRDLPMLNQMVVKAQTLPMIDIAEGAFNSLSANYLDSNITVEIDVPKDFLVYVDESLIQRVIINLMHNAFKFTPIDGTVLIRLVQHQDKPNYVRIQIADTGPGIPDDQRERIFGQYIQIEGQKPRTGGKGTGLGLNFCKLAVEAHGGEIWVEADGPLSGACFSFTIPVVNWLLDDTANNVDATD